MRRRAADRPATGIPRIPLASRAVLGRPSSVGCYEGRRGCRSGSSPGDRYREDGVEVAQFGLKRGDWARLTEPDFSEASSRLRRLARTYLLIYEMAGEEAWDAPRDPAWTLREIAEHVSGVSAYAEYVGNLR